MARQQHQFHGDPQRFEVLADYISNRYGNAIRYVADVAGGRGMLARQLAKRNYEPSVVDPRGWVLKGVSARPEVFSPGMADYYDLIVGLHPDAATRAVAEAALVRPAIIVPCCNFWSEGKLSRDELLAAIERYYGENGVVFERVTFDFRGPKNIGIVSHPRPLGLCSDSIGRPLLSHFTVATGLLTDSAKPSIARSQEREGIHESHSLA